MTVIRIERCSSLPVEEVWLRLTDWRRHAAHMPLTAAKVTPAAPTRPGTLVVMRTGVGSLAFDDPMEVVRWQPPQAGGPGHCRLEKRGSVVRGWAEIDVVPRGAASWLVWREELRVARLPQLFDAPTRWSGRLLFARVIHRLLAAPE